MDIAFNSEEFRMMCMSRAKASKAFPEEVVSRLLSIIADIKTAQSAAEFFEVEGGCSLEGPHIQVPILKCWMLECSVAHVAIPEDKIGNVEWSAVTRIRLNGVVCDG